jgi:DNA-directed RNA polymerase subunit RPC12/RpoP
MKTFKESTLDYRCTGCGVGIYNATKDYGMKCPECGYKLIKVKETKKDER